jgi:hypothetical protein
MLCPLNHAPCAWSRNDLLRRCSGGRPAPICSAEYTSKRHVPRQNGKRARSRRSLQELAHAARPAEAPSSASRHDGEQTTKDQDLDPQHTLHAQFPSPVIPPAVVKTLRGSRSVMCQAKARTAPNTDASLGRAPRGRRRTRCFDFRSRRRSCFDRATYSRSRAPGPRRGGARLSTT